MHNFKGSNIRFGSVEVIVGSMFSGKTEELLRLLRMAKFARQKFLAFKPRIDVRFSRDHVASHDNSLLPAIVIDRAAEIYHHLNRETQIVGIDEGQFFDQELVDVCEDLAGRGLRVIIAGLDTNWRGEPFHPMPALMAIAESVKKLHAVCVVCGASASRTQRLVPSQRDILVGDQAKYEPRCRHCFDATETESRNAMHIESSDVVAVFDQDELLPIVARDEQVRGKTTTGVVGRTVPEMVE